MTADGQRSGRNRHRDAVPQSRQNGRQLKTRYLRVILAVILEFIQFGMLGIRSAPNSMPEIDRWSCDYEGKLIANWQTRSSTPHIDYMVGPKGRIHHYLLGNLPKQRRGQMTAAKHGALSLDDLRSISRAEATGVLSTYLGCAECCKLAQCLTGLSVVC